jgi:hypothetical protein
MASEDLVGVDGADDLVELVGEALEVGDVGEGILKIVYAFVYSS